MCFNIYNDYSPYDKIRSLSTHYKCALLQPLMVAVSLHSYIRTTHWASHKRSTLSCC